MQNKAPRGIRLIVALVGRRNAGKSSLINALTGQETAIVSEIPGTTTDPVAKHYELLPIGPVTFYDTAGLDDTGELGELRIKATQKVLFRCDIAILVLGEKGMTSLEQEILEDLQQKKVPYIIVQNKVDVHQYSAPPERFPEERRLNIATTTGLGITQLKKEIVQKAPHDFRQEPVILGDLINAGDHVICVVPIDKSAPKGRLILPQVQVLREILDCHSISTVVKEQELQSALSTFRYPPALVVTDSQVVLKVANDVPHTIPMTTFSTLFARYKGDLPLLVNGASAIDMLQDNDTILIGEACSHHEVSDDIGRVKIPLWMQQYTGKKLKFEVYAGHDFPDDLERFSLVIHCGSCMLNRTEMLRRITECQRRGIPITNYGIAISKLQGVLNRVLTPFGL